MAPHSSTLAWKIPWTEELGAGYRPWSRKESGTTERLHFLSLRCCVVEMEGDVEASSTVPSTGLAPAWWLLLCSNHQHHSSVSPWSHLLKKKGNNILLIF